MTWVRLDDQFADHPKVVGLSASAFRLHVTALCYCARQETDGVIPRAAAFVLAAKRHVVELVGAGLWEPHAAGYCVHDFLDFNPSHAELDSKRDSKRIAGAKGAASRWHGGRNAPVPTRPDPLPRPDPEIPPVVPPVGGRRRRSSGERNDPVMSPIIRARIDEIERTA